MAMAMAMAMAKINKNLLIAILIQFFPILSSRQKKSPQAT